MVKLFNDEYTLTTIKNGLTVEEIENLELPGVISVSKLKLFTGAKVIAVRSLQSERLCICCNKDRIVPMEDNPVLGTCSACPTTTGTVTTSGESRKLTRTISPPKTAAGGTLRAFPTCSRPYTGERPR